MEQQPNPADAQPVHLTLDSLVESEADLTKICWTQLLREAESLEVEPQPANQDRDVVVPTS